MDQQDLRLQCLKMAFELGGNTEAVISAAQRMFNFIAGTPQPEIHDSNAIGLCGSACRSGVRARIPARDRSRASSGSRGCGSDRRLWDGTRYARGRESY
jgi:hypothetical protein